jgi:hypothetical protein
MVTDRGKQEQGCSEEDVNRVTHVRQLEINASLFSCVNVYYYVRVYIWLVLCIYGTLNIFYNQSWTADKGWSSGFGIAVCI